MKAPSPEPIEIVMDPPPGRWPRSAGLPKGEARLLRQQMDLPVDGPLVLSGHQATLWHPGIVAKFFAARAWAGAHAGWRAGWLVVDHDPEDFTTLRVPVRTGGGALRSAPAALGARNIGEAVELGCPACSLPTFPTQVVLPSGLADPDAGARVQEAAGALERARTGSRSAAEQVARATHDLIVQKTGGSGLALAYASRLAATDYFAALVAKISSQPQRVHATYNAALSAAPPSARLTPLGEDPVRGVELPLWTLDLATGARKKVFARDLGRLHAEHLAPRALLLTCVLRAAACDLFIHGLGGGASEPGTRAGYDRATEAWARSWLGIELAPSVVVSATLRLPLGVNGVSAEHAARAAWEAHAAEHDPARLGDAAGAQRKHSAVAQIAALPRRSADRRSAYAAMQADLDRARAAGGGVLTALRARAQEMGLAARSSSVALDRTWSFALHSDEALRGLDSAIRGRLTG